MVMALAPYVKQPFAKMRQDKDRGEGKVSRGG